MLRQLTSGRAHGSRSTRLAQGNKGGVRHWAGAGGKGLGGSYRRGTGRWAKASPQPLEALVDGVVARLADVVLRRARRASGGETDVGAGGGGRVSSSHLCHVALMVRGATARGGVAKAAEDARAKRRAF